MPISTAAQLRAAKTYYNTNCAVINNKHRAYYNANNIRIKAQRNARYQRAKLAKLALAAVV